MSGDVNGRPGAHGPRAAWLFGLALAAALLSGCGGTSTPGAAGLAAGAAPSGWAPGAAQSALSHPVPSVRPPTATPLVSAPAQPSGNGTTVTLRTAKGDIVIAIFTNSAPVAAQNFLDLARAGFYDGTPFHRIVPGFMIQGGDPTGTGYGGPGYTFPDEPFAGSYTPGTVAMANAGPDTNGSQFFIVVGPQAAALPHAYTIFGTVTSGLGVAEQIAAGPRGGPQDDQALQPMRILSVAISGPSSAVPSPSV